MTQENVSTEIWSQAHDAIYLNAKRAVSLKSKDHEVAINAGKFVGLTTKEASVYVASINEKEDKLASGSISLHATGDEPNVRLAAVPGTNAAWGSSLNLNQESAVLGTGKGDAACTLRLEANGAKIVSRSSPDDSGLVVITPEAINISIGTASILMTKKGITLSFGKIIFELNENGIKETHGETTRVLSSSSGNILKSDKMNQLKTVETSFEVSPSEVGTTAANVTTKIDGGYQLQSTTVSMKASGESSIVGTIAENNG